MTSSQSAIFERYPSYSGALAATEAEGGMGGQVDRWTGGNKPTKIGPHIYRQRLKMEV